METEFVLHSRSCSAVMDPSDLGEEFVRIERELDYVCGGGGGVRQS